jgi:predicted transcriptional regulator
MVHFRASPELIARIDALAAAERRTRSQWIKLTLENAIEGASRQPASPPLHHTRPARRAAG